jgi:hypothetical protein
VIKYFVKKFDWWVYWLFYKRWNNADPAMFYFLKLHMDKYFEQNPISEGIKDSAESFYQTLTERQDKGNK